MGRLARNADAYERFDRAVEVPMVVLAILWLPILIVPYLVHLSPGWAESFAVIDVTIWAIFAFEYGTKFVLSPDRWIFFKTHVLDLIVVVVPFLRPLRILRLIRVIALATGAFKRSKSILTHKGLHFVLLAAMVMLFAGAAVVLGFERHAHGSNIHNYGQALWWAVVTMSTVGYGDRYPVSPGGQGVAVFLMILGIAMLGVITASVASFFVEEDTKKVRGEVEEMREQLNRMEILLLDLAGYSSKHDGQAQPFASDVVVEAEQ